MKGGFLNMQSLKKIMVKKQEKETKKTDKKEIGITAEKDDFSEWFTQLMLKADLADYTKVSGCMVFKPVAYAMWEKIKEECDKKFKKLGIKNVYFPLLIPESLLIKEKEHVKGFVPEVAWVTQAGDSKLNERLAIRPTSETIMYDSYAKWIRSWRDLPLKYNQWNNVIRWEFKHPVPFMRTREFLWNEGHTVFATEEEALAEEKPVLNAYKEVCENLMALYGEPGLKTKKETFAGAVFSRKLHYIMPNGKAIEGPPFHHDGQNFAKAYGIKFLDKDGKEKYAWQNTWAITTRMLGVMFSIHSDDKGLILPPRIAPNKVVIIPILMTDSKEKVLKKAKELFKDLENLNLEPILDDREEYKPGYKFNEYELKGIPLRIEIGPKDLEKNQVIITRRDTGEKQTLAIKDIAKQIPKLLDNIHNSMFEKSKKLYKSKLASANSLEQLKKVIANKQLGKVPMCKNPECEEMLKYETQGAKAIFIAENEKVKNEKCIICNKKAGYFVYAGKSY